MVGEGEQGMALKRISEKDSCHAWEAWGKCMDSKKRTGRRCSSRCGQMEIEIESQKGIVEPKDG